MQYPLTPKSKWPAIYHRIRFSLRFAASFVIRSNPLKWSPTCLYASILWPPAPSLLYGTKLPGTINTGLRAIITLYRHFSVFDFRRKSKRTYNDLALAELSKSNVYPLGINLLN